MIRSKVWIGLAAALAVGVAPGEVQAAAKVTVLYSFGANENDGLEPQAGLVELDGTLYGTTQYGGGTSSAGTVFAVSTAGQEHVVYPFQGGSDGETPPSALTAVGGKLFGVTLVGGTGTCNAGEGCGTVFSVTRAGVKETLYQFTGGNDGGQPNGSLLYLASTGTFYGDTQVGGPSHKGTVFSLKSSNEKVVYSFAGYDHGRDPGSRMVFVRGKLYGTTWDGGTGRVGTVYDLTTKRDGGVLYNFPGGEGPARPSSDLLDVDNILYGATDQGGSSGTGTVYSLTLSGKAKVLHSFGSSGDGAGPTGVINVHGTLYGSTFAGGASACGTLFSITPGGVETVLYSFGCGDGAGPTGNLIYTNGIFYGTTEFGGASGEGTVFKLKT